ncbi:D-2-hydroxyacid dehydrogenase [Clostridium sp. Marseille-P2415]|uniref:D-2-hydroxyacid dehydrogenase n=1 Tax=Clostridium sp. Marseille-P2415 TaxID=1805471 RepID=UPI0009884C34|nr:D-2-hydroxyacid dehydrogenase [Clostridium sp. Marseille-P2415]
MREIKKVLATVDYVPEDLLALREIFTGSEFVHVNKHDTEAILREVKDADVAVLAGDLDDRFLGDNHLQWIHCDHAGLNRSARPEVFEHGILLSGSAGRSSPVLAEHCVYFMLNACYHTWELLKAQEACSWGVPGQETWRGLFGRTAGIIGMGHNGQMLAERLHAFGMDLITYDRNYIEGFDYIRKQLVSTKGDTVGPLLEQSDFVILCIQLSDQTHHMMNYQAFQKMKPGAILVNMARGGIVCTEDLIRALDEKLIACAGLDVFEQEPLPADSPLWKRRDVYITPHVTPQVPHRAGRCLDILRENVRRYKSEEELLNQVHAEDACSGVK